METLEYSCDSCKLGFKSHEELEKHYVQAHLDMTNERKHGGTVNAVSVS